MTGFAYLPHAYTWNAKSVQAALVARPAMVAFLARHPRLKAFSGLRRDDVGDHRCGFALDLVPVAGATDAGYLDVKRGFRDAVASGFPYVEPLSLTWLPDNHHLHISFRRCGEAGL